MSRFREVWAHPAVVALRARTADLALAALIAMAAVMVLVLAAGRAGLQGDALPLACIVVIVASAAMLRARGNRASQAE